MSETKWTPGPWGVTTRRGSWDWVVYTEANHNIEICQPFHDGSDENEIGEANARLIAAAPDLYAVLTKAAACIDAILDMEGSQGITDYKFAQEAIAWCMAVCDPIRAALRKARGEGEP